MDSSQQQQQQQQRRSGIPIPKIITRKLSTSGQTAFDLNTPTSPSAPNTPSTPSTPGCIMTKSMMMMMNGNSHSQNNHQNKNDSFLTSSSASSSSSSNYINSSSPNRLSATPPATISATVAPPTPLRSSSVKTSTLNLNQNHSVGPDFVWTGDQQQQSQQQSQNYNQLLSQWKLCKFVIPPIQRTHTTCCCHLNSIVSPY